MTRQGFQTHSKQEVIHHHMNQEDKNQQYTVFTYLEHNSMSED